LVRLCSILKARSASYSLRVAVFSEERKKLRATCMVMVLAPWRRPASDEVGVGRAQHAYIIDARVLIEALVLGGEDGVLERVGTSSIDTTERRSSPNSPISTPSAE